MAEIIFAKDKNEVIQKLCDLIETAAKESIDKNGVFYVGLSGEYNITSKNVLSTT